MIGRGEDNLSRKNIGLKHSDPGNFSKIDVKECECRRILLYVNQGIYSIVESCCQFEPVNFFNEGFQSFHCKRFVFYDDTARFQSGFNGIARSTIYMPW